MIETLTTIMACALGGDLEKAAIELHAIMGGDE